MQEKRALQDYPEILNARDISEYLGIGYVKSLNLIKYSGIPFLRIGNTYRINRGKFQQWLNTDSPVNVL